MAQGFDDATAHLHRLQEKVGVECPLLEKRVQIVGTSRDDLNGKTGVASEFDHARGRYVVELDSSKNQNEKQQLKLKPENLSTEPGRKKRGKKKRV